MFYAKFISDKYDTPTVGAVDGKPQNFTVRAFETRADRQAAIDAAWNEGGNGFKIARSQVERYFGRNFGVYAGGECDKGDEYTAWERSRYADLEAQHAEAISA